MVEGLEEFKKYFGAYTDDYVLIGGIACLIVAEEVGLSFRATKDFDIVLLIEVLNQKFISALWDFVKKGGYQTQQQSSGKRQFYRFRSPSRVGYPKILELFSRKPELIKLRKNSHLTPIPVEEELSSLSAILLDEEYYSLICRGKREVDGLSILGQEYLIPLKVRAYINLSSEFEKGEFIDRKDIRKHRKDVLFLFQLLARDSRIDLPESIQNDMGKFLRMLLEDPIDLKEIGLKNLRIEDVVQTLAHVYNIPLHNELYTKT